MRLLLSRYVLRDLVPSFGLGLLIFTVVLLMDKIMRIVEWIVQKGVPFMDVLKIFGALMPNFFVLTMPTALLLSVLLTFSRLHGDHELHALKACGISLYQLLPSVYSFGTVVFGLCLFLTTWAVPHSMRAFQSMVVSVASQNIFFGLKERVFFDEFPGFVIYIEHLDLEHNALDGVFIADENFTGSPMYYFAKRGRLSADPGKGILVLSLEDGTLHRNMPSRGLYQIARFGNYRVRIDLGALAAPRMERTPQMEELTLSELREEAQSRSSNREEAARYWLAFHQRLALPFAAIVFCTLGIPLSLISQRAARYTGFSLSIVVVLAYFILMKAGTGVVQTGGLPAILGAWVPNLVLGALGVFLLVRKAEEKPLKILERYADCVLDLQEWARRVFRR
jgi:lipopolysaccharide export system permease protein